MAEKHIFPVHELTAAAVLAKKKKADMKNKEVVINAKAAKQTKIIESEGNRDRMVREAEGKAQQLLSRGGSSPFLSTDIR